MKSSATPVFRRRTLAPSDEEGGVAEFPPPSPLEGPIPISNESPVVTGGGKGEGKATAAEASRRSEALRVSQIQSISFQSGELTQHQPHRQGLLQLHRQPSEDGVLEHGDVTQPMGGGVHSPDLLRSTAAFSHTLGTSHSTNVLDSTHDPRSLENTVAASHSTRIPAAAPAAAAGSVGSLSQLTTGGGGSATGSALFAHHSQPAKPHRLDQSIGPSALPSIAFPSQEATLAKYSALFHTVLIALDRGPHRQGCEGGLRCSSRSEEEAVFQLSSVASFLGPNASSWLVQCGFPEWNEQRRWNEVISDPMLLNSNHQKRRPSTPPPPPQSSSSRVVVVNAHGDTIGDVTTTTTTATTSHRGGARRNGPSTSEASLSMAPSSSGEGSSIFRPINSSAVSCINGPAQCASTVLQFLADHGMTQLLTGLLRECIAELPRLVQAMIAASPWKQSREKAEHSVLARSNSNVAGNVGRGLRLLGAAAAPGQLNSSASGSDTFQQQPDPLPLMNGRSRSPPPATSSGGGSHPTFALYVQLCEALLFLLDHRVAWLLCNDAEFDVRQDIALENLFAKWPVAKSFLCSPMSTTEHVARLRRNPAAVATSQQQTVNPATELHHAAVEWSRLALAASHNAPPSNFSSNRLPPQYSSSSRRGSEEALNNATTSEYMFTVCFSPLLRLPSYECRTLQFPSAQPADSPPPPGGGGDHRSSTPPSSSVIPLTKSSPCPACRLSSTHSWNLAACTPLVADLVSSSSVPSTKGGRPFCCVVGSPMLTVLVGAAGGFSAVMALALYLPVGAIAAALFVVSVIAWLVVDVRKRRAEESRLRITQRLLETCFSLSRYMSLSSSSVPLTSYPMGGTSNSVSPATPALQGGGSAPMHHAALDGVEVESADSSMYTVSLASANVSGLVRGGDNNTTLPMSSDGASTMPMGSTLPPLAASQKPPASNSFTVPRTQSSSSSMFPPSASAPTVDPQGASSINQASRTVPKRSPNPLSTEALTLSSVLQSSDEHGTCQLTAEDEEGVVRVRVDPTGTFVIPFGGAEPILLDGVHIHEHLALIGVEFMYPSSDTVSGGSNVFGTASVNGMQQQQQQQAIASAKDEADDRFEVCMWNSAMSRATGYQNDSVLAQPLVQVMGDSDSYDLLLRQIRRYESSYNKGSFHSELFAPESIPLKFVHKEWGSCSFAVTLSPVVRYTVDDAFETLTAAERLVCIGMLVVGVPIDPQQQLKGALAYRSMYLAEVLEEVFAWTKPVEANVLSPAKLKVGDFPTAIPPKGSAVTPMTTSLNVPPIGGVLPHTRSNVQPLGPATAGKKSSVSPPSLDLGRTFLHRRVNEYFLSRIIEDVGRVDALNDVNWRNVYTNFIPGILHQAFPSRQLKVRVERNVPPLCQLNVSTVTRILDQLLNLVPTSSPATTVGHHAAGGSLSTPPRAVGGNTPPTNVPMTAPGGATPPGTGGAEGGGGLSDVSLAVNEANAIRVTVGLLENEGGSMYIKLENVNLSGYVEALCLEMDVVEGRANFGMPPLPAQNSLLPTFRSADAVVLVAPGSSTTTVAENKDMLNSTTSLSSSSRSQQPQQQGSPLLTRHHADVCVVLFPYRPHAGGAHDVVSPWETRKPRKEHSEGESPSASQLSPNNSVRPDGSASALGQSRVGKNVEVSVKEEASITVLLDMQQELERQKLIRQLWSQHHSVFPVEAGKFLSRGVKLLQSQCRSFDIVIAECPPAMSSTEFEKKVEDTAKDFPETHFVVLRSKKKAAASGVPPLAPQSSVGHLEKAPSVLISFMPPTEARLPNVLFLDKRLARQDDIDDLIQQCVERAKVTRHEKERKSQLQKIFREHRTSPWTRGKKLGKGTFGDVFEACLQLTGGKMAVKIIRLPSSDPSRMEQLINEVEILARVSHPNIVQYFYCEAGTTSGEVNIFMELCKGGSLGGKVQSGKVFDMVQIASYMQQLLSALAYLHRNHLAHRDIKPANVLLSEDGKAKLADFGTATAVSVPLKEVAGTFAYMAPEVYNGVDYGTPCDVWSVGCVMLDLFGKVVVERVVGSGVGGIGGGYFSDCTTDQEIWDRLDKHIPETMAADFLKQCFRLEPMARWTAEQLLLHPFLIYHLSKQKGTISPRKSALTKQLSRGPSQVRQSTASSIGALSLDSGQFDQENSEGSDDDSSDDGWGDLVPKDKQDALDETGDMFDTTGNMFQLPAKAVMTEKSGQQALLGATGGGAAAYGGIAHNLFTPKNALAAAATPHRPNVCLSPAAIRRHVQHEQRAGGGSGEGAGRGPMHSAVSPTFHTTAAALARRQSTRASNVQSHQSSEVGGGSGGGGGGGGAAAGLFLNAVSDDMQRKGSGSSQMSDAVRSTTPQI